MSNFGRLAYLDGWRGIAILCVLIGHFIPFYAMNMGRVGVELFLVLSGRLMGEILFLRSCHLPSFYWRRFSRIFPALFVFIIGYAAWLYIYKALSLDPNKILAALFFYSNYYSALGGAQLPEFDHTWSLAVEEHGYVVLSLILVICSRNAKYAGFLIASLALAAIANGIYQTYVLHGSYTAVYWRSDVRMASILMSVALCIYVNKSSFRLPSPLLVLLGLAGVLLNLSFVPDAIKYSLGTACLAIVVNLAADLPAWTLRIISFKPFLYFGISSYSIYLWQQPFHKAIQDMGSRPILLTCAVICGLISYWLIESPLRRWLNDVPIFKHKARKIFVSARSSHLDGALEVNGGIKQASSDALASR